MVVHQKILHLLLYEKSYGNRNNLQVENTQDRNLGGRVVGEVSSVSVNLKANSFSVISRRLYYQVIKGSS